MMWWLTAFFECIVRFMKFIWDYVNHDSIIAVGTMMIAMFTWTLRRSTDKLWTAGEKQRALAEDAAKRQLRAYLGVKESEIRSDDCGNTFVVHIVIINSGHTPARQVTHRIAAELQIQHGATLSFEMPNKVPGEWVMVPNVAFTLKCDIAIGGASGTGTIDIGQRVIFTWGRVDYLDAFDRPQHFEFRYRSTRSIRRHNGTVMTTVGWEMDPEDQGNTTT